MKDNKIKLNQVEDNFSDWQGWYCNLCDDPPLLPNDIRDLKEHLETVHDFEVEDN